MKFNATDFKIKIKGSPNKEIQDTRDLSISIAVNPIDVSTRDSAGWLEQIRGQKSWTATLTGVTDYQEKAGKQNIATIIELEVAGAPITFVFGNEATGSQTYEGTAIITNSDLGNPYEDAPDWSVTLSGTGPIILSDVA